MFLTVLFNVLIMLVYMLLSFVLCKAKKGVASHAKTLSAILVYVLTPAMIINSFLKAEFSKENIIGIGIFFVVALLVQLAFFAIMYLILRKKYDNPKYRIMTLASMFGNVGFFGLPIITTLFPEESIVSCYCMAYVVAMNILTFTLAEFMLTREKKYISVKRVFINPSMLSFIVALPLFIFGVGNYLPNVVNSGIEILAKMVTPLCMFVLGMRLSEAKLKDLVTRPTIYLSCGLKLVIFPLFALAIIYFVPWVSWPFKATLFILSGTPSASFILNLAELHDTDQELAANSILLATIFTLVTLPLLALIISH